MKCDACNGKHVKHTCGKNKNKKRKTSHVTEITLNKNPTEPTVPTVNKDKATKASEYSNTNSPAKSSVSSSSSLPNSPELSSGVGGVGGVGGSGGANVTTTIPVPIARPYNVGETVHAIWHNGLMYEAKIIDLDKKDVNRYIVKWNTTRNDYKNCNVHLDYIRKSIKLEKDMAVSAMYYGEGPGNGHMFKAKIESIDNEFVNVIWDDNSVLHRKVYKYDVSPLNYPKYTHNFKVGDKVLAKWYGQDNGYMYTAVIETVNDKVAKVRWDDGVRTHRDVGVKDMLPYHVIRDVQSS